MNKFDETLNSHRKNLELYVPVVARVHGPTHPVFYDVQKQYELLMSRLSLGESVQDQFDKIKMITDNYKIPEGVCETYEAVYQMLQELDTAYHE